MSDAMDCANNCKACAEPVKTLNFIKCQGFCEGMFHLSCTTLTKPNLSFILESDNVYWFRNNCSASMKKAQLRAAFTAMADAIGSLSVVHKTALEDVKEEMKRNRETVAALATKISDGSSAPPATPTWPTQERRQLGVKRRLPPTPKPKPELPKPSQGRKVASGSSVPIVTNKTAKDLCWIWLASFPPSVTEADIGALARDCLSCDDEETIDVKALVKKGTDVTLLSSITFKVGVDKKYRDAALDENTWPSGVSFREFVDFGAKGASSDSIPGFTKTPRLESPTTQ